MEVDQRTFINRILELFFTPDGAQQAFNLLYARASGWPNYSEMMAAVSGPIAPCFVRGTDNTITYCGLTGLAKVAFSRVYQEDGDVTAAVEFTIDVKGKVFI